MKFNYITCMVRDLERSVAFYQDLAGLRTLRRFQAGPGEIVFLANAEGETMLELIQFPDGEKVSAGGMVLSFLVGEDLPAFRERAVQMGYDVSELIHHPTKPTYCRAADPDGITVEFTV